MNFLAIAGNYLVRISADLHLCMYLFVTHIIVLHKDYRAEIRVIHKELYIRYAYFYQKLAVCRSGSDEKNRLGGIMQIVDGREYIPDVLYFKKVI